MSHRTVDSALQHYVSSNHLYEVFEALLSGICVMLPDQPQTWIAEQLKALYDIGFINLNWDTFIDPSMRPVHPLVDHEVLQLLFGAPKQEVISQTELRYEPTPEMFIKARKAFNGTISHKCFHAWKFFRALTIVRRAFKQKLNYVARQHWLMRKKVRIFRSWNEWNRVVRGRYEVATNLLCNVRNELIARVSIRIWRAIARDVQRARSHHAKVERESQQLDKLSATQLESKYTGDIFKVRDRPQDRVGYLPEVLQEKIFSYLTPGEVAQCARVCRAWMLIAERVQNVSRLDLSVMRESLDDVLLGRLLRRRRICLRQINLHECSNLTCHGFRLLAACSNLQDINLSRCLGLTDDAVRLIVESCPLLLYLNLSHTLIFDQAIRHLAFQAKHLLYLSIAYCLNLSPECSTYFKQLTAFQILIYLDLSGCEQIGPICLQDIFKSLPKVRHWILNSLPWMTDTELKMLGDSCQVVETVELLNCVPPKLIPASLSAGLRTAADSLKPELVKRSFTTPGVIGKQRMDRSRPGRITDTGLLGLCGRGLKRFLASGLPYVDGSGFQSLNPNPDLPRRTSNTRLQRLAPVTSGPAATSNERNALTQFTVTDCPRLSERTLNHLQQSPYLTVLNLSGNRQLGDAGVKIISDSAYVGCLRELYLTGCDRLTDRAVHMIDQRFSQLAYLSLAGCPLLTDVTLTVLAQLRRLWQLNLSETKLGDKGLAALGSIPKLSELKVSECTGISDHGLQRFAKDGTHVTHIDLSFCHSLTDNGIKTMAFCCRFMVHLNLAGCSQITDMGIQYLSGVCQYLRSLNLSGCVLLSSTSLVYLKKGCKLLEHLILLYCKGIKSRDIGRHTQYIKTVDFSSKDPPEKYVPKQKTFVVDS